jgi:hypothetical protein
MELWYNGKGVMTRMPQGGGHEGEEDTGLKQATPEPPERKCGSIKLRKHAEYLLFEEKCKLNGHYFV